MTVQQLVVILVLLQEGAHVLLLCHLERILGRGVLGTNQFNTVFIPKRKASSLYALHMDGTQ